MDKSNATLRPFNSTQAFLTGRYGHKLFIDGLVLGLEAADGYDCIPEEHYRAADEWIRNNPVQGPLRARTTGPDAEAFRDGVHIDGFHVSRHGPETARQALERHLRLKRSL